MSQSDWLRQVKRGVLELCILNLLDRERMYGYQLVKRLAETPGMATGAGQGVVTTVGTIYPLLSRLKRQGLVASKLVESPAGPARRVYTMTPVGRAHLKRINLAWRGIADAVEHIMSTDVPGESEADA